eukprot:13855956-Alexandrium_andersonii.AAC.1
MQLKSSLLWSSLTPLRSRGPRLPEQLRSDSWRCESTHTDALCAEHVDGQGCRGQPVSYTHLRAHETSAHL